MDAVIFDLDGVLVNTHDLVVKAYRKVGVNMPPDAYGKPWTDWLVEYMRGDLNRAEITHNRKVYKYSQMLHQIEELPCADLLRNLVASDVPVGVLTGSSRATAVVILHKIGVPAGTGLVTGCSLETKKHELRTMPYDRVFYIDDMPKPEGWDRTMPNVTYSQYIDQTYEQIEKEVRTWMQ